MQQKSLSISIGMRNTCNYFSVCPSKCGVFGLVLVIDRKGAFGAFGTVPQSSCFLHCFPLYMVN